MDKRKPEDALKRRIRKLIRIEMEVVQRRKVDIFRIHYIYDRRKKIHFRLSWLILLGINFSLLFYQVRERIEYYHSEPTTVVTKIDNNVKTSVLPRFILCSTITIQSEKQFSCEDFYNVRSNTVKLSNLNLSTLWELFDNEPDIEFTYTKGEIESSIILKKVPLPSGTCNSFIIGDKDNFFQNYRIKIKSVLNCSFAPITLLIQDDDILGYEITTDLDQGYHWHFIFNKLTQLQFLKRKRNRCVDRETHEECLDQCKRKILDSFNYSCGSLKNH